MIQTKANRQSPIWGCRACINQMMGEGPRCFTHNPTPEMRAADPAKYPRWEPPAMADQVSDPSAHLSCGSCTWEGMVQEAMLTVAGPHMKAECPECMGYIKFVARLGRKR